MDIKYTIKSAFIGLGEEGRAKFRQALGMHAGGDNDHQIVEFLANRFKEDDAEVAFNIVAGKVKEESVEETPGVSTKSVEPPKKRGRKPKA